MKEQSAARKDQDKRSARETREKDAKRKGEEL